MKYHLGEFLLDTKNRTLTRADEVKNIRPKTLELLMYLAERRGEVVGKKELLENVWDDVQVDEGVIFQSIAEIRKLVEDPKLILNYPRRGYEFREQLIEQESLLSVATTGKNAKWLQLATLIVFACFALYFILSEKSPSKPAFSHHIAVLPVKNHVEYAEPDWVSLSGMEQLIARLQGLSSKAFIYQSTEIPKLMHLAGLADDFVDSDVTRLFEVSGASLIIETDIYGGAHNFNLVYKFHVKNDVKQGTLFDTSVEGALSQLSQKVAEFIAHPLMRTKEQPQKEFSDALFAQAIISYESDWQTSISFFESYLALNPNSIIARHYLSRLYLWQGRIDEAESVIAQAKGVETDKIRLQAFTAFVQGQVAAARLNWQAAIAHYEDAQHLLVNYSDWSLKADIYLHRGLALEQDKRLVKAMESFSKASSYYETIQSPIGINSSRLHTARVLFKQGKQLEAEQALAKSKAQIESKELAFLYSLLAEQEYIILSKKTSK